MIDRKTFEAIGKLLYRLDKLNDLLGVDVPDVSLSYSKGGFSVDCYIFPTEDLKPLLLSQKDKVLADLLQCLKSLFLWSLRSIWVSMMIDDEIKPCAFCGGKPFYETFHDGYMWFHRITCSLCHVFMDRDTKWGVIGAWNREQNEMELANDKL